MKAKLFFSIVFLMIVSLETLMAQTLYNVQAYSGSTLYQVPMFSATGTTPQIANSVFFQNSAGTNVGATNLLKIESAASPYGNFLGYLAGNANTGGGSGTSNVGIGYNALMTNYSGEKNTATGTHSLKYNYSGSNNTANGYGALNANTGSNNTAVGYSAMILNTSGANNTATGYSALYTNTTGSNNTANGLATLYSNTTGSYNTVNGYGALYSNVTGSNATAIGSNAMYYSNSTATPFTNYNVAVGYEALRGSTTAANNTGNNNIAIGYQSLWSNTTGSNNTANGYQALYSNTAGSSNTANGYKVLYLNTTGSYNTANGYLSLTNNTDGSNNTANGIGALSSNTGGDINVAIGDMSLFTNTTGDGNVAVGSNASGGNTTGSYNTALGASALANNSTGTGNVAVGIYALQAYSTGDYNTALGYYATRNGTYSNATAIGRSAVADADYHVRVGVSANTQIGGYQNWTNVSDGRFKINVQENVKGLEFIKKLRPITYNLDAKAADDFLIQNMPDSIKVKHQAGLDFAPSTAIIHSGFIAQEVEQAAIDCGFQSSIVSTPANSATTAYGLAYAEIVVPLVRAVQEQQKIIDSMKVVLQGLLPQGTINKTINNSVELENSTSINNIELANNAVLYQNSPNPFSEGTTIKYFVPDNANVQIIFMDEFGNQIKEFKVEEKGMGTLHITASNLAAGMYSYSLIVNGRMVDTKKMIKQ